MNSFISTHGGNLNYEAERLGCKVDQLLDASASLVPFDLNRSLKKCLIRALHGSALRNYPDRQHQQFREVIGYWHQIDSSMVLPGNGASELITWAARDASVAGLSTLPVPGFGDYQRALLCWDADFVQKQLPLSWTSHAPQPFPISQDSEVLWITNPHNPTGQLWSRDSLEPLLNSYELVICDEAFLPLVPDGEKQSLIPLVADHPNLIVIRSLTKLFALAGLRLGYAITSPERLERWYRWRDPWPVNGLALAAGINLMTDGIALERWINRVQEWVKIEGKWLHAELNELPGITPFPSAVNFLLIHGDTSLLTLREQMSQKLILLRDCRSFVGLGDSWLRIGLQQRSGNRRILEELGQCLVKSN